MIRHKLISSDSGAHWQLQRIYPRGLPSIVHWCGRGYGWVFTGDVYSPEPKRYTNRQNATRALKTILAHERELGLASVRYERVP